MDIIRSMIERVEVSEGVERSKPNVVLVGDLAAILAYTQNNTAASIGDDGRVLMVAGTGLNEALRLLQSFRTAVVAFGFQIFKNYNVKHYNDQ